MKKSEQGREGEKKDGRGGKIERASEIKRERKRERERIRRNNKGKENRLKS